MDYEKLLSESLSNDEIAYILSKIHENINMIALSDMQNINTLDEVFRGNDHAIIFVSTTSETNGHWQILINDSKNIFFFDSYGHNFTKLLRNIFKRRGNYAFNQSYRLGNIITNSEQFKNGNVYMNTIEYQNIDNPVDNTCGRHCICVLFCYLLLKERDETFNFLKYYEFIDEYMQDHDLKNPDYVVINITERIRNMDD